jgi:hypothetical protein
VKTAQILVDIATLLVDDGFPPPSLSAFGFADMHKHAMFQKWLAKLVPQDSSELIISVPGLPFFFFLPRCCPALRQCSLIPNIEISSGWPRAISGSKKIFGPGMSFSTDEEFQSGHRSGLFARLKMRKLSRRS